MTAEEKRQKNTQYAREWRNKNRERHRAYQRQYSTEYRNRPEVKKRIRENRARFMRHNPLAPKAYSLTHYFGISLEQFNEILEKQNGVCAICFRAPEKERTFHVDHDHTCCSGRTCCGKCVRGLLCGPCNRGLGQFKDNPESLLSAVEYLNRGKNK